MAFEELAIEELAIEVGTKEQAINYRWRQQTHQGCSTYNQHSQVQQATDKSSSWVSL